MVLKLIKMKKREYFEDIKEYLLAIILILFSLIIPWFYCYDFDSWFGLLLINFIPTMSFIYFFSYRKTIRLWGFMRFIGFIFGIVLFFLMAERWIIIQDPRNVGWVKSSYPFDDERFVKLFFAFLTSLFILGIGEIIIYLRDIRLILALNKNNKDYFKCDSCEGKGFIEKMEYPNSQKKCSKCEGLGFLEKNSNNWFPRKMF